MENPYTFLSFFPGTLVCMIASSNLILSFTTILYMMYAEDMCICHQTCLWVFESIRLLITAGDNEPVRGCIGCPLRGSWGTVANLVPAHQLNIHTYWGVPSDLLNLSIWYQPISSTFIYIYIWGVPQMTFWPTEFNNLLQQLINLTFMQQGLTRG